MSESLKPDYFDDVYRANEDPWNFQSSPYEKEKYAATLAALPRARYGLGLEIGCSIGVLTAHLAERCDFLLSVDVAEKALAAAKQRCAGKGNVEFLCMEIPQEFPEQNFDLIVVSEVAYYWGKPDLEKAANVIAEHQPPGAHLVLVHWTPYVADYPQTGDEVHEYWLSRKEWKHRFGSRQDRYRLDLLERTAPGN